MKKHKKCVICKKKYVPIHYAVNIQHGIPHGNYIEISYLLCGKCPTCAWECYDNKKYECQSQELRDMDDTDDMDDIDIYELGCYSFFDNELAEGYGDIGGYINFYDIK